MASKDMAEKVRQLREARGYTQEILAERARVTVSTITILEGGQGAATPSREILQRLARALGVHLSKLTGEP